MAVGTEKFSNEDPGSASQADIRFYQQDGRITWSRPRVRGVRKSLLKWQLEIYKGGPMSNSGRPAASRMTTMTIMVNTITSCAV